MTPRPFQAECLTKVRASFDAGKRAVLVVAPTGSGKTCMGAMLAAEAVARGERVAWGAHRGELVVQASDTLRSLGLTVSERGSDPSAQVHVGTYQQWVAGGAAPEAELFVSDEAHHMGDRVGWQQIPKTYKAAGARLIGLTATPARADDRALPDFDDLVVAAQIADLQALGLLKRLVWRGPPADRVRKGYVDMSPLNAYKLYAQDRTCVVFAPNVRTAYVWADEFTKAGIRAEAVDGVQPKPQRARALQAHADGKVKVLTTVALLTEGWDNPRCDAVIVGRWVESVALWIQMTGRGLRQYEGSDECALLDLCGNAHRLGRPDSEATYSLEGDGIVLSDSHAATGPRRCKVCKLELPEGEYLCRECGHDNNPPIPRDGKATELEEWRTGWEASKAALDVSRYVLALAGIMRKARAAERAGKPWKNSAVDFRFRLIFKRSPSHTEYGKATHFLRTAENFPTEDTGT